MILSVYTPYITIKIQHIWVSQLLSHSPKAGIKTRIKRILREHRSLNMENAMRKLLIATMNQGKAKEIKALLSDLPIDLVTPDQLDLHLLFKEDGNTYTENATKKALAYAEATDLLTLADDSGLEVDALDGSPGLFSARFSPKPNATDADRRAFLLEKLNGLPRPWKARFRCVVALHDAKKGIFHSEGICQGEIVPEERGKKGFGYDPIFQVAGGRQTMAELSMEEKNKLSHRAIAVLEIKPTIVELFDF
jgi:XTP/dITP diphosphohydrolase